MALFRRLTNVFRRSHMSREIAAELAVHLALRTDENLARGMAREEAERDARIRFGNPTATRERVLAADAALSLERLRHDVRMAVRQLGRSPGFTATAILTLALAIGANAVVFNVLNQLILRPLNLPDPGRLYTIEQRGMPMNSYPDYRDLRARNRAFADIALYNFNRVGFDTGGSPQDIWIYEASGNYFDVLGAKPYLGRFFHAEDEHGFENTPYLVLSYAYWRERFHGDPGVIGRAVELNRHAFTILGVAAPQFHGNELIFSPALWAPIVDQAQIEGSNTLEDRSARALWMIGRLRHGVTAAQGESDLNRIAASLRKEHPADDDGLQLSLSRPGLVGDLLGGPVRAFVAGLMLLAGMILLAACANLGSLFAARASDRAREIALRVALGSTRRRILVQLLAEAILVSLGGAALGVGGSIFLLRALRAWQPVPHFPISLPVHPDLATYAVALALAFACGLLFGLTPLRQILAAAPWEVVKSGNKTTAARGRLSTRDVLLVVQIAVCAVLVTASLVAVRGLNRSLHSNFGFEPRHALLLDTDLNMGGYQGERIPAMQRRMVDAALSVPGVSAAGTIDNIPLGLGWTETSVYASQSTRFRPSSALAESMQYEVSPGYFAAAGTTLLAGRSFTWNDGPRAPLIAVVNATFARKVFGSVARAVGASFRQDAKTRFQVVGVVEDGKYITLTEDERAAFYQPLLQAQQPPSTTCLVVRSTLGPQSIANAVHQSIRDLDPALPVNLLTWDEQLDSALFAARAATISLSVLGLLGALLAATGMFAMASAAVVKRMKEMGIRMALGADRIQLLGATLGRAVRLLGVGSALGLVLGIGATRLLASIVYQASPRDPMVLAGAVLGMLLIGLVSIWAPAHRAMGVDPSQLMREE